MEIISSVTEMKAVIRSWKAEGLSVGLVPTMGYLHDGHMSLVRRAVEENDRVVVSVFVNPIQFGVNEDLDRYPRDLRRDAALCAGAGAAVIFHPDAGEMYPEGFASFADMSVVTEHLCGARRPGHFRGVCTVVMKLFNIVSPDKAYFGQKDAQQLAVIRRMGLDFNMDVQVVGLPIVREADGLALSSRNTYLSQEERVAALCLHRSVKLAGELYRQGVRDAVEIKAKVREVLDAEPLARVDYVEVADADTMQPVSLLERPALCAIAVYINNTRLIDNIALGGSAK